MSRTQERQSLRAPKEREKKHKGWTNRKPNRRHKLASRSTSNKQQPNPPGSHSRRRSSVAKSPARLNRRTTAEHASSSSCSGGATSGPTACGSMLQPPLLSPISSNPAASMSLSRSPSPRAGGGWSSPGLTPHFDTMSGRSSPRKPYTDLHVNGGVGESGSVGGSVTWASAKARSDEVNGYPSFSTRNNGFFSRHARRISSSLPKFNLGGRRDYADKEKLGRGRWGPNGGSRLGRIKTFIGSITRRMRLRILIVLGIVLAFILFYTTREFARFDCLVLRK